MNSLPDLLPIAPDRPWLAPLAGYTDLPFRLLCREYGAAVACTEMVSAKGLVYGQGRRTGGTEALLLTVPDPRPGHHAPATEADICSDAAALSATTPSGCIGNKGVKNRSGFGHGLEGSRGGGVEDCQGGIRQGDTDDDRPLVVQLFGAEPDFLAEAVRRLRDRGYQWFDLNMGCSVPKVVKSGAGAAMLRDPKGAVAAIRAMAEAAPGRVGCKIRLGWQGGEEVYLDLSRRLQDAGVRWISLHPRYARQGFGGTADWDAIRQLKQEVAVPVMASGDLFSAEDAVRCLERTCADGLMFARGAMQDPMIFRRFLHWRDTGFAPEFTRETLQKLIARHIHLVRRYGPDVHNREGIPAGLLKMRSFVPRYCKHLPGIRQLRSTMVGVRSWEELDSVLAAFFSAAGEEA